MNQIPISNQTVFLDLSGVRAVRGGGVEEIHALVESGALMWVFDFGGINGNSHQRNLRFWLPEIRDAAAVAKLGLPAVIGQILPVRRSLIFGREITQWFGVSRQTTQRIGRETGGIVKAHRLQIQREALADFLARRWIGASIKREVHQ